MILINEGFFAPVDFEIVRAYRTAEFGKEKRLYTTVPIEFFCEVLLTPVCRLECCGTQSC